MIRSVSTILVVLAFSAIIWGYEECEGQPVAVCIDVEVAANESCVACVSVDDGSFDSDSDEWWLSQIPPCDYPLGETYVTLTVTDSDELWDTCEARIMVYDESPPSVVDLGLALWPPNHQMIPLHLTDCAEFSDNCSAVDVNSAIITSISSDEADDADGNGDGNTEGDIEIGVDGSFQVRAERAGDGNGRVYRVFFDVEDASGNVTEGSCTVSVPHDQGGEDAVEDGSQSVVGA